MVNDNIEVIETLLYYSTEGAVTAEVIIGNETLWATQKTMGELFGVNRQAVTKHLQNIFSEKELIENSVCSILEHTASDGKKYKTKFYNLDAIVSVGYRVNSKKATQFRIWATGILKEYMVKGFVLDDELLKNGKRFDKDYFNELLERIREIRTSERRFNEKITDIYAECSYDYQINAEITRDFFASVQNKLIYSVTHKTAAEIIADRSNSDKPFMGLTTWKNPKGKILMSDVVISKNYLKENEMDTLNRVVEGFLNIAELRAKQNILMSMNDWKEVLNSYIKLNQLPILTDKGKITAEMAKNIAKREYLKFKPIQDKNFKSDFDKMIEEVKNIENNIK